jgi:hypothetical protein
MRSLSIICSAGPCTASINRSSKFFGLWIAWKHGFVNHTQHLTVALNKDSSLSSAILQLDNPATTFFICPKVNIVFSRKSCEGLNTRAHPLIFGNRIHKRTCDEEEKNPWKEEIEQGHDIYGYEWKRVVPAISWLERVTRSRMKLSRSAAHMALEVTIFSRSRDSCARRSAAYSRSEDFRVCSKVVIVCFFIDWSCCRRSSISFFIESGHEEASKELFPGMFTDCDATGDMSKHPAAI